MLCTTCLKCFITTANVLFAVFGKVIALLGWLVRSKLREAVAPVQFITAVLGPDAVKTDPIVGYSYMQSLLLGLIVVGCFIFATAVFGCCSTFLNNTRHLTMYGISLAVLAIIELPVVWFAAQAMYALAENMTDKDQAMQAERIFIILSYISIAIAILMLFTSFMACWLSGSIKKVQSALQVRMAHTSMSSSPLIVNHYTQLENENA